MRNLFLPFVCLIMAMVTLGLDGYAQQSIIRGRVTDANEGAPLVGARVLILQNNQVKTGANTDLDGEYTIRVAAGTYQLVSSYFSYESDTIDISVASGKITAIKTELKAVEVTLEGAVITADRNKEGEAGAVAAKFDALNQIEVISAEQSIRIGANDAGDMLRIAPAVTVTEGKYVNVRGLSDRYNKTLINMGEIPALDPEKETVQMDLFPARLIGNITVYKNFTPDLPGAFSAGLVNLETRSHPLKFTLSFSGSIGYNDVSSLNADYLSYQGGRFDWLGVDDGTRAQPSEGQDFPEFYPRLEQSSGINQNYNFTIGDQKLLFGNPFGYVVSLTYRRTFQNYADYELGRYRVEVLRDSAGNDGIAVADGPFVDGIGTRWQEDVLAGATANLSYKIGDKHKISFTFMRNQGNTDGMQELIGRDAIQSDIDDILINTVLDYEQRALNSFQLKGRHTAGIVDLDWVGSYSISNTDRPDLRFMPYFGVVETTPITVIDTTCFTPDCSIFITEEKTVGAEVDTTNQREVIGGDAPDFGRRYLSLNQQTIDFKMNGSIPLKIWSTPGSRSKLKVGGAYTYKNRTFSDENFILNFSPTPQVTIVDETGGFFESSIERFFAASDVNYVPFLDGYAALQRIYGGYAMMDLLPREWINVVGGVRYEYTYMAVDGDNDGSFTGAAGKDDQFETNDFLPALHFILTPNKKMHVRFGYSRTLARPSLREVATFVSPAFRGDLRIAGSPFVRRSLIDNVDLRYEWMPSQGEGEILSVGGFYKEIAGPIEAIFNPIQNFLEFQNLRTGSQTEAIRSIIPKQLSDDLAQEGVRSGLAVALAYGVEFEFRKHFGFIGDGWKKLRISGNYSILRTEVPLDQFSIVALTTLYGNQLDEIPTRRRLYGQPTSTLNTELAFIDREKLGLDVSVSYNRFGDRLIGILEAGVGLFEQSRGILNASVRKTFGGNFAVRVRANNLLNPAYKISYQAPGLDQDLATFENSFRGRSYSIGISYDL